ncbi:hypothetical protein SDJN02_17108, partial [Cucurbita argyrosperma subsp. argyrosperma]
MVVGTATATATAAVSRRLAVSRMGLLSGTLCSGPTNASRPDMSNPNG